MSDLITLLERMSELERRHYYMSHQMPPEGRFELLWACYWLDTNKYDQHLELIAQANGRPLTPDDYGLINSNARRARQAVTMVAGGEALGHPGDSRYAHWKTDDLMRRLYGTDIWNMYLRAKMEVVDRELRK